ncbi:acetoacetyl-CoA synthetase [Mycena albidolilacea]|uniref:Acetoacetyl-CoA synthetase n=1 Tax=Mycena albidolilacea TaxID=1033008 RepID=A0AAD6Z8L6_9AGAR|nr:acetoacetyl-CoA synthetase [Mycena albidolilacea]
MNYAFENSEPIWKPVNASWTTVERLRRLINSKRGLDLKDYHDLHKYSVESYDFWLDLWEFLGVISSVPPKKVIEPGTTPEVPIWFPDARLNYAENLLGRRDDGIACTTGGESGVVHHYSHRQLNEMVRQMARALRLHGLKKGDRVAAIINNTITAIVICLATASIGGIYSSTATDMGAQGILDRYRQIRPKFVFAETEVQYVGKVINLVPKISEVFEDLRKDGLQHAITLPSLVSGKEISIPNSSLVSEFLAVDDGHELIFEQLPFGHPLYILYSSGTSGPPKCIVHSAGATLLQGKKELRINAAMDPDDTFFQYTTTGWMMWTFMIACLATGTRAIVYDGSPFYPDTRTFLKFISDQSVSGLGTSPRFLAEVQGQGINPLELASFESLKVLMVNGAVLTKPLFKWAQRAFGERVHIMSTCGGTDVCTAFVTGCPSLPVYAGETQHKSLGMKVEVFDDEGKNIEHTGIAGEMVCTRPHPSIPVGFWGDDTGAKFREAYYSTYPGIWRQGDFMVVNPKTKGIMILGRSDGVLNPSGIRFGSSEIYSVLEQFTKVIDDSLCVGQRRVQDKDERVLLFLKMRKGYKFDDHLVAEIKGAIRKALSARHVPSFIFEIEDIPYTVNGKRIEIAVKQIVSGSNLKPSGTVANPESLKLYYKYRDLETIVGAAPKSKL